MSGWDAGDVPDQRGRTVVVTGANGGLGLEVTRVLAGAGATVVMACRDVAKARSVASGIDGRTVVRALDLSDLSSVRSFAGGLGPVDVLVNNAGVLAVPWGVTADGFERHIGVNHLGPFLLTGLLINRVRDRVVTVTSGLHVLGRIDDDLQWQRRRYRRWSAYAQSKLANLLFAYELQRRLVAAGRRTMSVAAHPGVAATEGQRRDTSLSGRILAGGPAQSPRMGALPILYAATVADVPGGGCVGPDGLFGRTGHPTVVRTSRRSRSPVAAARLWSRSEELVGARYDIVPLTAAPA
ncbi:oxidoreductase [Asanoa sp. WMMD1127]|uniref:oxidoreductase n=1 Tax=Asanoa sp. WMMD1127 TaxID=3016107 RepID=UPI002415DD62|nr:oxidoreductase [Asanoa sp. WMMD1127]MDG4825874.1 oxidoreductase [Asanoa sp. WMMD1127]